MKTLRDLSMYSLRFGYTIFKKLLYKEFKNFRRDKLKNLRPIEIGLRFFVKSQPKFLDFVYIGFLKMVLFHSL